MNDEVGEQSVPCGCPRVLIIQHGDGTIEVRFKYETPEFMANISEILKGVSKDVKHIFTPSYGTTH